MRYKLGDNFKKYPEKDIISSMIKLLLLPIRRYLECRGIPITYAALVEYIQDYEASGSSQEKQYEIKQEPIRNKARTNWNQYGLDWTLSFRISTLKRKN